jgi:hypothetical protein
LSVSLFDKTPILEALSRSDADEKDAESNNQLILFN